eukprot:c25026_g4_i1 orf=531-3017(-)
MVGVGVNKAILKQSRLTRKGKRSVDFFLHCSAHRDLPLQQSLTVEGLHTLSKHRKLSALEDLQTFCSNGKLETFCSSKRLQSLYSEGKPGTHRSHGTHEALCSHEKLETHYRKGKLEAHSSHGKLENLCSNGKHETLYSSEELATLYSSAKIPSDDDIQTLCRNGRLEVALNALSHMFTVPSYNTYLSLLQACTKQRSLAHLKHVHAHLASHRLELTTFLGDYLVIALAKCGGLDEALHLFHRLPRRTVFSYAALISMLADRCRGREALQMHTLMQKDGVEPNHYTYVGLLKACGTIPDLKEAKKLHADVRLKGFAGNVFVGSTLVSMYGRCGNLMEAENVFSELIELNVVSYNAMLTAYVEHGQSGKALLLYRQMLEEGTDRDQGTFVLALQACGNLAATMEGLIKDVQLTKLGILSIGQALHVDARRKGFALDFVVGSVLVTMYGKCGTILDAENVFVGLPEHDRALWNAMLSAYIEVGEIGKSLRFYLHMHEEGMTPDQQTFAVALRASEAVAEKEETFVVRRGNTRLSPLVFVQALYEDVRRKGIVVDEVLSNTLVSAYGKWGAVAEAEKVFLTFSRCSTVSWNAMLSVFVEHHNGDRALQFYRRMQEEQVTLDDVSLIYILQACNETGCVETCQMIHFTLTFADLELDTLLTTTLIHANGGCASMKNAESVFNELVQPDTMSWTACIAGYGQDGNCMATFEMLDKMQMEGVNPDGVTLTPVLSSCNHSGLIEEGINYINFMSKEYGLSPELRHYASLIDLFGRAGDISKAKSTLGKMPMHADLAILSCLLNACRTHGNVEFERLAYDHAEGLEPRILRVMPCC